MDSYADKSFTYDAQPGSLKAVRKPRPMSGVAAAVAPPVPCTEALPGLTK